MKVFVVIILATILEVKASSSFAQNINLNEKSATLTSLIKKMRQQSGYDFLYDADLIDGFNNIKINVVNSTVEKALNQTLKDLPLAYTISNKLVVIKRKVTNQTGSTMVLADSVIRGQVFDSDNKGIPGVTVYNKTKKVSVQTNASGSYTIKGEKGDILVFSYIGFAQREVPVVLTNTPMVVILKESITDMKDVVVTGIFNKAKESYTGAVTTITADQIQANRGQNLLQTIKNLDPAFQIPVNNSMGSNPNVIPDVTIRGRSSLPTSVADYNAGLNSVVNVPLVIMDGFEISLTRLMDFNDEDIESINILKDASATAIYGSRGANGVIVIIRKKPKPGKLIISPRVDFTTELPDLSSYDMLSAAEILQLQYREGLYSNAYAPSMLLGQNAYNERLRDVLAGVNTDWLHFPIRTGLSKKYGMRLEGGSNEFVWGANLAYNSTQGAMRGSERNTLNGDITLSYTYKNLLFRNQLSVGINKGTESPYGAFSNWVNAMPYDTPYGVDGSLKQYLPPFLSGSTDNINPLYDASLNTMNESRYTELINNFTLDWQFVKGFRLVTRFGISKRTTASDVFLPANHSAFRTYTTDALYFRRGRYTYNTGEGANMEGQATLSYSKNFGGKHQVYAGLDVTTRQVKNYNYGFIAEGFPAESKAFLGNAVQYAANSRPTGTQSTVRTIGLTSNVNYTYNNRYFADLSYRVDGSSQFGSNNRFAPFWSAGLGWNVHHEDFLKNNSVINLLRLRGSVGENGSQQFSAYQAQQMYEYSTNDRYINRSGASLIALGNENLKWQVTKQLNGGAEINIFNSRISASVDYYVKTTSNLLSSRDLPFSTGFTSFTDNVGEVKNTGFETSLNAYVIRNTGAKLNWMLGTRMAYNKNRITKLSNAIKAQSAAYRLSGTAVSTLFEEGYDQNSIWAVRSLGIDPSTGQELFLDANGNLTNVWSASAKVFAGINNPKYNGNLTSVLRYANFTFNLNIGFRWGGQVYNQTLIDRVEVVRSLLQNRNMDRRVLDQRWSKPGDVTFFKAFSDAATLASTRFVMDDNVLELQSASLDYNIAKNAFLKKYGIQNARFGINMSDLLYLSSIKRERGTSYPYARRAGLYLSLTF
ncbi:SusC/RagA family TonB-linked outer membrane protein [Pedobacter sp. MC2016-14]|uniref:SusC/RagA family TonB-linked outer membrane protein n=1 Tax=Pedobacter sp. MC2016-14 TaxID=2897327 RepID=UPI001E2B6E03|nr:SusC/RagA family TonB-linked outer membrane protein [Pedobacter sp. MC2016-14]MCD0486699.1 SusC/RagA family TonB-linked outer membrane protein [Pedobacter sp. MC2016-14]